MGSKTFIVWTKKKEKKERKNESQVNYANFNFCMNYPFNKHIVFIITIKPTRKWGSSFLIFGGKQAGLIFPSEWDPISYLIAFSMQAISALMLHNQLYKSDLVQFRCIPCP